MLIKDDVCEASNGELSEGFHEFVEFIGRYLRSKVALCMVPLMFAVMTIGGRIVHPCCIGDVCRVSYFYSFLVMVA